MSSRRTQSRAYRSSFARSWQHGSWRTRMHTLGFETLESRMALANSPPLAPVITEPVVAGQIVSPADVHMEIGQFSDPDAGALHDATQWEIWTTSATPVSAWTTLITTGVELVHVHLGDGSFVNNHSGRSELFPDTNYQLRVRVRDNSGEAATQWSTVSTRNFRTSPLTQTQPLEATDVASSPAPQLRTTVGANIVLPAGNPPAQLSLESETGALLLRFRGLNGAANEIINPPALAAHAQIRVVITAGSAQLSLPESNLTFFDDHGEQHTIYLPAVQLPAGQSIYFWVSANGSTYTGAAAQTEPDFSNLVRGAPVPWTVAPGYRVEVVATGFQLPVNISFIPNPGPDPDDPLYYVNELYGTIKVVRRNGTVSDYATNLLNFNPTGDFPGSGEQGLAGLVVDPTSGDVFASMVYSSVNGVEAVPHYPKVVRFHSNDGGLTAATQTTILNMVGENQGQSHQVSNLTIGPDGKLYLHNGDGFNASTARNLNSYRGKILRFNLDGTAPNDNPFYNAANGINSQDYIYALGFRNPFGGAWRASDGKHYEVENGPATDRFAQVIRGEDYLWDGDDSDMLQKAIYTWSPARAPVNITFVQPETFGGSGFPQSTWDHAFVSQSGPTWATGPQGDRKAITEFVLDAAGNRVSGPTPLVTYNGAGKATVAGIAAGPDGLYFSDLYKDQDLVNPIARGANILRVRYVGIAVPDGPNDLLATPVSDTKVSLEWENDPTTETGYRIERSPNGTTGWATIGTTAADIAIFDDTGRQPNTQYFYRVFAFNAGGDSRPSNLISATTLSTSNFTASIDFQPANAPTFAGYLVDSGAAFANRGNGFSYGWNATTTETRDRNSANAPDQRFDTLIHMQRAPNPNASWELAVPRGVYQVHLVAGDPTNDFNANYRINIEGALAINRVPSAQQRFFAATVQVTVLDGRLTISNAAGSATNKIGFIDVVRLPIIPGTSGADTFYVRTAATGPVVEVYDSNPPTGAPFYSAPLASLDDLTINAGDGADSIVVNHAFGNPIPAGGLFINGGSGNDSLSVQAAGQTFPPSRIMVYESGPGTNTLSLTGGAARVDSTATGGELNTIVAGAHLTTSRLNQRGLTLDAGAKATILPGADLANVLSFLTIDPNSTLDLTDNELVLRATSGNKDAVHAAAQAKIASARGGLDPNFITNWSGPGITSSTARTSNVATGFDLVGLGVIRNSDLDITTGLPGSTYSEFGGVPVSPHDVLIKYTYIGDTNLNGVVSFDDYVGIDNAFFGLIPNLGWATGDVNFDTTINFDDYSVVDQAFFFQAAPLAVGWAEFHEAHVLALGEPEALAPEADFLLYSLASILYPLPATPSRSARDLWDDALLDILG